MTLFPMRRHLALTSELQMGKLCLRKPSKIPEWGNESVTLGLREEQKLSKVTYL